MERMLERRNRVANGKGTHECGKDGVRRKRNERQPNRFSREFVTPFQLNFQVYKILGLHFIRHTFCFTVTILSVYCTILF